MFAGDPACILSFSKLSSRIWNLEQHLPERAMVWLKHTSETKKKKKTLLLHAKGVNKMLKQRCH